VEPQTNWTGTEDEPDANRVLLASVRSRNYLRIHEVVPTFVGVSQGEGEGGFLRGVWGDPEGGARPGAAEVTGGPAEPASPPPAGGPGVVAARFAAAVAELGLLAGAPRARLGAATVGRVAAAIPLSSLDGDEAGWREVARNLVESAVAKDAPALRALGVPERTPDAIASEIAEAAAGQPDAVEIEAEARESARRIAKLPVALVHGDLRCRNVLATDRGVVIRGWGSAYIGCALLDVVRLVADVIERGEAVLGIGLSRLYAEKVGIVLPTEVLRGAEKLDRLALRYLDR